MAGPRRPLEAVERARARGRRGLGAARETPDARRGRRGRRGDWHAHLGVRPESDRGRGGASERPRRGVRRRAGPERDPRRWSPVRPADEDPGARGGPAGARTPESSLPAARAPGPGRLCSTCPDRGPERGPGRQRPRGGGDASARPRCTRRLSLSDYITSRTRTRGRLSRTHFTGSYRGGRGQENTWEPTCALGPSAFLMSRQSPEESCGPSGVDGEAGSPWLPAERGNSTSWRPTPWSPPNPSLWWQKPIRASTQLFLLLTV